MRRGRRERLRVGQGPTAGLFPPALNPAKPGHDATVRLLTRQPSGAKAAPRLREAQPSDALLVVVHVHYPECWPDIAGRLVNLTEPFDLLVTLTDSAARLESEIIRDFPRATIELVPNRGRDIGPLVSLANRGLFSGYDAVLKVHSKRSPHRLDGDGWRLALLDGLLPDARAVDRVVKLFRADSGAGLVVPSGHLAGSEHWGSNQSLVEALASRIPLAFDPDRLRFPAGSMYWVRPWILERLADLGLEDEDFEVEGGQTDGTLAHAIERLIGLLCEGGGLDIVETRHVPSRLQKSGRPAPPAKRIAFYLPQYHPIPENDEWWGEGFTDWVNVEKARPLFTGHRQPHRPGPLGYYDLRDPAVLRRQAALARDMGIDGFCFYHYWFGGKRLLETPLDNLLADPSIDLPFALCWANESWTRRWDGLDHDTLIAQSYPDGWMDSFYEDAVRAWRDPRHIRAGGKPVFVVYRIGAIPDAPTALDYWNRRAKAEGLGGLHRLAVIPSRDFETLPADVVHQLDGLVRFPPGSGIKLQSIRSLAPDLDPAFTGDVFSYDAAVDSADLTTRSPEGLPVHLGVMPGWDNTARRGTAAYVFHSGNAVSYRRWLRRAEDATAAAGHDWPAIFINAWNEWAEGAHLEPGTVEIGSRASQTPSQQ